MSCSSHPRRSPRRPRFGWDTRPSRTWRQKQRRRKGGAPGHSVYGALGAEAPERLCYRLNTAIRGRYATFPLRFAGCGASRLPPLNSKGMPQQPEMPVSSIALGPASLPGPGGEFVPAAAGSNSIPAASNSIPVTRDPIPATNHLTPAAVDSVPVEPSPAVRRPQPPPPERIPPWLVQTELFVRVMLRMFIGLLVFCAPWWPALWDQNFIFLKFPAVGAIALNGAVRGLVSGLGLLNLWIAFQDALSRGRD